MKKLCLIFFALSSYNANAIGPVLQTYCTHLWLTQPTTSTWNNSQKRLFALGSLYQHIHSVDFYGLYCPLNVNRDDIITCADAFQAGVKFSCFVQIAYARHKYKGIPYNIERRRLFIETVEDEVLFNTLATSTNNFDKQMIAWLQQSPDERELIFGETPATIQNRHALLVTRLSAQPSILITIAHNTYKAYLSLSREQLDQWRMLLPCYALNDQFLATLNGIVQDMREEIFKNKQN